MVVRAPAEEGPGGGGDREPLNDARTEPPREDSAPKKPDGLFSGAAHQQDSMRVRYGLGSTTGRGGLSPDITLSLTVPLSSPSKGASSVRSSYITIAKENTSDASLGGAPVYNSGDKYCGVPPSEGGLTRICSTVIARPKSHNFTRPGESGMVSTLFDFRSLLC